MKRRTLFSLHRWIFIFMGIFMLIWLISGVVMSLPDYWFVKTGKYTAADIDYRTLVVSPAAAVTRFEQHHGGPQDIRKIRLNTIGDDTYYLVRASGGLKGSINARTGEYFDFPAALAEQLARQRYGIEAPLAASDYLTEYSATYPNGHLPVYRLGFTDRPGHYYYVNTDNGNVDQSTLLSRVYHGITSLHAFDPLVSLTGNNQLRMGLLFVTGAVSLLGTIIGVILIFPLRRKRAQQAGQA